MGVKEFILGHKRYCVTGGGTHGSSDCVDHCFTTKTEAKKYKKDHCDCFIQKQVQRKPFTCPKSSCTGSSVLKTEEKE